MDDLLEQGITAYKAGKREEARKIFISVIKQNPENQRAWGWMYNVSSNDTERIYCLKQVLRINPNSEPVSALLSQLTNKPPLQVPIIVTPTKNIQPQAASLKLCPYCAEEIQAEAIVCKHCGRDLNPAKDTALIPAWRQGVKIGFVMALLSGCYTDIRYGNEPFGLLIGSLMLNPAVSFIGGSIVGTSIVLMWRGLSVR